MNTAKVFKSKTGLLGSTEPGQYVNQNNVASLPAGSVVRNKDGSRLIHLHDGLWLWCCDNAWRYDRINNLKQVLAEGSVLCHIP